MPPIDSEQLLRAWLANLNLADRAEAFIAEGRQGEQLLKLERENLADLGVPKDRRGEVMLAVEALRRGDAPPTLPDRQAPSYAPALSEAVALARCRKLGRQPPVPWVAAVADTWPGPIAHEYQRLRQVLEQGQIVAAIFQLKDVAEVLIKFPALVMARDLIQHGDAEAAATARRGLFGGLLSLGTWASIVREQLAPQVVRLTPAGRLLLPELGTVFVAMGKAGQTPETPWLKTLCKLVEWRNAALGHGAFRLDPQEYLAELEKWLGDLNRHLAEQVERGLWAGAVLRGEAGSPPDLSGWRAIRHWHEHLAGEHTERETPLILERGGRVLRLAPLVALRRCTVCDQQDVFLYDSRGGRGLNDGFKLLDYLAGHGLTLPPHRAGELATEAGEWATQAPVSVEPGQLDEDYGNESLNKLLESRLLEARYLRPDYLREPLRKFVAARDRGVFWLTAPSHTGKSVFAHGLAFPAEVGDQPLWPETAVGVLHIRREFRTWPEQLRYFILETILHQTFQREPGRLRLPELDVHAPDPAADFANLMRQVLALKPVEFARLVVILDGLDELPPNPAGQAGIADFIPRPDALPEGCFLLLTSRPLAECPPHIQRALAERFTGCADFARYELCLDDASGADYRQLLRAYFDRELQLRWKADLHQALAGVVENQTTVTVRNDLKQAQPAEWADFAKTEWTDLTRKVRKKVRVRSPASAPSLAETVVRPVRDRYDAAFATVLNKATGRFLYVAHLTELLGDGRLSFQDLADLPAGIGLYEHYLRQLEQVLAAPGATGAAAADTDSKPWAFARRLILTLAAAEQAHVAYQNGLPVSVRDEVFRGVPLAVLEALLDEPARSTRLIFTLYSFKEILATWKGEDARDACYALGLKDFVATVAVLWPEALTACHRRLAVQMLEALEGRWDSVEDDDPLDRWRLHSLAAHADQAGDDALRQRLVEDGEVEACYDRLGKLAHSRARYGMTTRYWSLSLSIAQRRAKQEETAQSWNNLAGAYLKRGRARNAGNDLSGALADDGQAIDLMEALRARLGAEWPSQWTNLLATIYSNRGVVLYHGNDLSGALADHNQAIDLMEALRAQLGAEWSPAWAYQLALAYVQRGVTRAAGNDLSGALADYGQAIDLQEVLRTRQEVVLPPEWANDLARAYMNRGITRHAGQNLSGALADYDTAIALREALRARLSGKWQWPPAWANDLAGAYMNRGIARSAGQNLSGALADYDTAIALREALRIQLGTEWPSEWGNDLAMAYMNRGNARDDSSNLGGALADYDTAIALREALRARLGTEWPPAWANDLAAAYLNRGIARSAGQNLSGALADYDTAIALREALRTRLGAEWPPAWANDLAAAYLNRGIALEKSSRLEEAVTDWAQAAQIYLNQIEQQNALSSGTPLLTAVAGQFGGFRDLGRWPEAAQSLMQFLMFYNGLQTAWADQEGEKEPPWQSVVEDWAQAVHALDTQQRARLLEALGEDASSVKEVFGWE